MQCVRGSRHEDFDSVFRRSSRRATLDNPPEGIARPPLATAPSKALQKPMYGPKEAATKTGSPGWSSARE